MNQLDINKFLDFTSVANLKNSPNNKYISYVTVKMRLKQNDYLHSLYLDDGSKVSKIINLKKSSKYYWETENTILYFDYKNKDDKDLEKKQYTIVYRYNIESKKDEIAYTFPIKVSSLEIINNGLLLNTNLNNDDHILFDDLKRDEYLESLEYNKEFEVVDSIPFYQDGGTYTKGKLSQSFFYIDNTYYPLSDKNESVSNLTISNDKNLIYYTYSEDIKTPSFFKDIRCFDISSKKYTNLTSTNDFSFSKLFELNNNLYALGSYKDVYGMNQNSDIYKLTNNTIDKVLDFSLSSNNSIGSDVRYGYSKTSLVYDSKYYFIGVNKVDSVIYEFDGEKLTEYLRSDNSIDGFLFSNNDLYTIEISDDKLQEVYKNQTKHSKLNDKVLENIYIAKPIHHEYKNGNVLLDGWVLLPKDYDKSKKYPSILDIHGGPKTIYNKVFYNEMQVWANLGYIVYFTNPRGSDSYGNDFMDIRGKYGSIDYDDLMCFTDFVLDNYSLDESRMGVTGGSYGGFMTNWIVTHTNRFKVAATQRSISNWTSFAGVSDIGSYFAEDQTAADPISEYDKAWDLSPLKYADNIKTPLLFIHSDADYRCPLEQALQLYSRVKLNNVDTKLILFKGECHDLSRSGKPKARLRRLNEITDWMSKYLLD